MLAMALVDAAVLTLACASGPLRERSRLRAHGALRCDTAHPDPPQSPKRCAQALHTPAGRAPLISSSLHSAAAPCTGAVRRWRGAHMRRGAGTARRCPSPAVWASGLEDWFLGGHFYWTRHYTGVHHAYDRADHPSGNHSTQAVPLRCTTRNPGSCLTVLVPPPRRRAACDARITFSLTSTEVVGAGTGPDGSAAGVAAAPADGGRGAVPFVAASGSGGVAGRLEGATSARSRCSPAVPGV